MNLKTRKPIELVSRERKLIDSLDFFKEIFNSISTVTLVLNSNRQILYASNDFLETFKIGSETLLMGKRPGEAIFCKHSNESTYGCGNSTSCSVCGLLQSVIESRKTNKKVTRETRITAIDNGISVHLELSVTSVPIVIADNQFHIVTLTDISSEKRKLQLEKIFLHDLFNTVGGISGLSDVFNYSQDIETQNEIVDFLGKSSKVLIEQVSSYRDILQAESGDLEVKNLEIQSDDIINEAISLISYNKALKPNIIKASNSENIKLTTDKVLLSRILVNMLKNATEAEYNLESKVVIGSNIKEGLVRFWVKNNKVIPRDVQKQIFQRSFSTKGSNRGLGTYSMKLLGEKYLEGKVGFNSDKEDKTLFYIELPYLK